MKYSLRNLQQTKFNQQLRIFKILCKQEQQNKQKSKLNQVLKTKKEFIKTKFNYTKKKIQYSLKISCWMELLTTFYLKQEQLSFPLLY